MLHVLKLAVYGRVKKRGFCAPRFFLEKLYVAWVFLGEPTPEFAAIRFFDLTLYTMMWVQFVFVFCCY
jgi:hypothetical protein